MKHITITREQDIRGKWTQIVPGLDCIIERAPDYLDWSHHNLMGELMHNGNACKLYLIDLDDKYAGFVVLRFLREEFTLAPICLVWLCYLQEENLLDEVADFVDSEARRHRCKFIRMETNRPGWGRLMKRLGGKVQYVRYQREL